MMGRWTEPWLRLAIQAARDAYGLLSPAARSTAQIRLHAELGTRRVRREARQRLVELRRGIEAFTAIDANSS
jgi:hypothetical protein